MVRLGDNDATFKSLPPNFQTVENKALGYAVDRQMKKLRELSKKLNVWGNISNVNPRYYDIMAACLRAQYYSSEYTDDIKLEILQKTLQTYMFAGTMLAVEGAIANFFPEAEVVPWYEYGNGMEKKPFHFSIQIFNDTSEDLLVKFMEILKRVKSQRSILDKITTKAYVINLDAFASVGAYTIERLEEV